MVAWWRGGVVAWWRGGVVAWWGCTDLFQLGVGVRDKAGAVGVLAEAVMGDDRTLLGEALYMLRLLAEEAPRDEEREVGVLVVVGLAVERRGVNSGWRVVGGGWCVLVVVDGGR